jgi:hypothetical protein
MGFLPFVGGNELRMRGDQETIAPLRLPDATKDEACPQRSATPS